MRLRPPTGGAAGARRPARLAAVLAGSLLLGTIAVTGTAAAAPATTKVSEADLEACGALAPSPLVVCEVLRDTGTASVVEVGADSHLRISTPLSNDKATVWSNVLLGQPLGALTTLSYRALVERVGSDPRQAPAINIEINPGEDSATFATLVWEPVYTSQQVTPGQWQEFSPLTTPSGAGGWWSPPGDTAVIDVPNRWGFKSFTASFADVRQELPNARIGRIGVNQGGGNTGLISLVDQVKINDLTLDFQNPVTATTITKVAGDGQSTNPLTAFTQPLGVKLTGAASAPAADADVTFAITAGDATFPGGARTATARSGADGVATSPVLNAGPAPGPVTVVATSGTLTTSFGLTVRTPPGPPVADLALSVTGVPATAAPGATFTATVTVRNTSSFAATRVSTAASAPSGLRVTAAPGGIATPPAAAFVVPTLAPGAEVVHKVTFRVEAGARGARTITFATNSAVVDPDRLDNLVFSTVTVR